jgi:hypothetical protein
MKIIYITLSCLSSPDLFDWQCEFHAFFTGKEIKIRKVHKLTKKWKLYITLSCPSSLDLFDWQCEFHDFFYKEIKIRKVHKLTKNENYILHFPVPPPLILLIDSVNFKSFLHQIYVTWISCFCAEFHILWNKRQERAWRDIQSIRLINPYTCQCILYISYHYIIGGFPVNWCGE